jgi:hypothetical protein
LYTYAVRQSFSCIYKKKLSIFTKLECETVERQCFSFSACDIINSMRLKKESMKKTFLTAIIILSVFVYAEAFAAGVPSILSYQGRLADSNGDLLGGSGTSYYFKFSIWDNSTVGSGTRLWPSSESGTTTATVRDGVFSVNIGDTDNGYPDALNLNFNINKDLYLQVEVSSDNNSSETLSPRQRISSAVFSQLSGAVSGTGQSSIGTTTPVSEAVLTAEATTTATVPLAIRGFLNQATDLLRILTSTGSRLLTFTSGGKLGIGTSTPNGILNLFDANSTPQLRISQTATVYGEVHTDASGDVAISSTGGNIRHNNENVWVCSGGACGADDPSDNGNVVVETGVVFDNNFTLKQIDASTTIMYDTTGSAIFQFDEAQ